MTNGVNKLGVSCLSQTNSLTDFPLKLTFMPSFCRRNIDPVSGYGILAQNLRSRREKKLNEDLVRVRELQQQLGVLRSVRSKKQARGLSSESPTKKGDDETLNKPKKETKGTLFCCSISSDN